MSNEYMENDIDDIFKEAIESVNSEPSDKFWRKAAEDVIARESERNEKKASRWRAIAFILGAGLLLLGYFTYRMQNGINNAQQMNVTVNTKQNQLSGINNNSIGTKLVNKPANNIKRVISADDNHRSEADYKQKNNSAKNSVNGYVSPINSSNAQSTFVTGNKPLQENESPASSVEPILIDKKITDKPENQHTQASNDLIANLNTTEVSQSPPVTIQKNTKSSQGEVKQNVTKTTQLPLVALVDSSKSSANDAILNENSPSKFNISAFFSPDFAMGYMYKCTNSWGDEMENTIKLGEKQTFSFTAGVKAEYQISSRFSINVGIAYHTFNFNINPYCIYAQKQSGGDIGYALPTSSGIVDCPYYGYAKVGDSLKMSATSSRTYLEIPIHVKYFAIRNNKFKFYLTAGVEANFTLGEETYMYWQEYGWNVNGAATVTSTNGSESMYFSYFFGLGAEYKIGKHFSLYAEPGMHEAITPIDNNIEVVSYPRLISATAGLTYFLK